MNAPSGPDLRLHWLFNHSLQAGVLVLLVLLVQWVFRRQLTHRWRFALWWIVLARLLLPFSPESAVSLFNVFRPSISLPKSNTAAPVASPVPMPDAAYTHKQSVPDAGRPTTTAPVQPDQIQPTPAVAVPALPAQVPTAPAWNWRDWLVPGLTGLWLAGVLGLAGVVGVQFLRFHRRLAAAVPADESLCTLLADCRREFGNTRAIELLETDAVQSPALFGLFRLRLLLPRGLGGNFNRRELRYIFLHELAHVRRGDLWLNWLVTALQILHWFNPLLWLGFARLRADRELACDELALLRAGDTAGTAYGETVVKLLERLSRPAAIPGLIGILEDKQQMRRRISMIANFRRPGRWSVLAVLLVAALALAALTDAQTSKPAEQTDPGTAGTTDTNTIARLDLTGQVTGADGSPLPVPARVFIVTAVPKASYGNHSIYDDCDRNARADAQGNFRIEATEPGLMFQILAVAQGYQPQFYEYADPARGTPLKIQLQPLGAGETTARGGLPGRVVDAQGRPIADAVVDLQARGGADFGPTQGQQRAMLQETPAVTDGDGQFSLPMVMPTDEWMDQLVARVTAQGYAGKTFKVSRTTPWELVMTDGASLQGRVLRAGRPLAGVTLRMSQLGGVYDGHYQVRTDARGNFKFAHLPPEEDFQFSSPVETLTPFGAVPPRQLHTAKEGAVTDLGDLAAGPTHHLAGRVVLSDGQPLSSNTWLMAACDGVFLHKYFQDMMRISLGPDGAFDVPAFPVGTMSLYLSGMPAGYHWSGRNLSVDPVSRFQLSGRVDRDVTNLVFRLDPGVLPLMNQDQQPDYPDLRTLPLRGAENTPDPAEQWTISGRVLDAVTRQPIPHFQVTAGRPERNFKQQAVWDLMSTMDGTNGVYQTYIRKHTGRPLLKVEAEGYLPVGLTNLPAQNVTNADFILQPGSGVAGRVVRSGGQPVAGATVLLLNDDYNQAQFYPPGILALNSTSKSVVGNPALEQTTDAAGRFTFKPLLGMKAVAAANTNGFALVSVEALAAEPTITLTPYGMITGTVTRGGRPATNDELNLRFDESVRLSRGLNLGFFAHPDTQGRYALDHVPAGHLFLYANEKTTNGYGPNPATQNLELKPGQTLEVNLNPVIRTNLNASTPAPKRIPGEEVKGVVLGPDGQPAADAEVALQMEGRYLGLGKAAFVKSARGIEDWIVNARTDGSFTLPLYEPAQSVVAVSQEGYAQVSLEQLRRSPQVTLQKWGRIEGTLRVGRRPGTNEVVSLNAPLRVSPGGINPDVPGRTNSGSAGLRPPSYNMAMSQTPTDEQGRFVFTFVPPGEVILARQMRMRNGLFVSLLARLEVPPGGTLMTNVGGGGRTVTGRIKSSGDTAADYTSALAGIVTPDGGFWKKIFALKTQEEQRAFAQSDEAAAELKNSQSYAVILQPDGSFRAENVPAGRYELSLRYMPQSTGQDMRMLLSTEELVVPPAKDDHDDSAVDWGAVAMTQQKLAN